MIRNCDSVDTIAELPAQLTTDHPENNNSIHQPQISLSVNPELRDMTSNFRRKSAGLQASVDITTPHEVSRGRKFSRG